MASALLGMGQVLHKREHLRANAFRYAVHFALLPMRSAWEQGSGLARNRFGLLSFYDADHGDGKLRGLAWLDALLLDHGVHDAKGEVWLQTFPRVLGYAFKPVSFWFCERTDGTLRCVVVEVNNTFGERHVYLLGADLAPSWGEKLQAEKCFHVSPFFPVEGHYEFRFLRRAVKQRDRLVMRIDYFGASGSRHLHTSVHGDLSEYSPAAARRAFFRYPLMTLMVIGRIHFQALKLLAKRVPFFSKPDAPQQFVSRH